MKALTWWAAFSATPCLAARWPIFTENSGPHDLDIAVPPSVLSVKELGIDLARCLGGACQPHNLARGVYQVIVPPAAGAPSGPLVVDLVRYQASIEEDMDRRDFTVNAMALPLDHPVPAQR